MFVSLSVHGRTNEIFTEVSRETDTDSSGLWGSWPGRRQGLNLRRCWPSLRAPTAPTKVTRIVSSQHGVALGLDKHLQERDACLLLTREERGRGRAGDVLNVVKAGWKGRT